MPPPKRQKQKQKKKVGFLGTFSVLLYYSVVTPQDFQTQRQRIRENGQTTTIFGIVPIVVSTVSSPGPSPLFFRYLRVSFYQVIFGESTILYLIIDQLYPLLHPLVFLILYTIHKIFKFRDSPIKGWFKTLYPGFRIKQSCNLPQVLLKRKQKVGIVLQRVKVKTKEI